MSEEKNEIKPKSQFFSSSGSPWQRQFHLIGGLVGHTSRLWPGLLNISTWVLVFKVCWVGGNRGISAFCIIMLFWTTSNVPFFFFQMILMAQWFVNMTKTTARVDQCPVWILYFPLLKSMCFWGDSFHRVTLRCSLWQNLIYSAYPVNWRYANFEKTAWMWIISWT